MLMFKVYLGFFELSKVTKQTFLQKYKLIQVNKRGTLLPFSEI